MQMRVLGHSGLQVSVIGLGCNNFGGRLDQAATDAVVRRALAQDVTSSVIAGATRPKQIDQNVAAASWVLTPEELAEISRITSAS